MEWRWSFKNVKSIASVSDYSRFTITFGLHINYTFSAGGAWLITDMRRGESMFELDPSAQEEVERGFELEGSNLSGVSARCSWAEQDSTKLDLSVLINKINVESLSRVEGLHEQVKPPISASLQSTNEHEFNANYRIDDVRDRMSILESTELLHVKKLEALHLIFNLEAGSLLPLAIR